MTEIPATVLGGVRERRAGLGQAMRDLEAAAAAAPSDAWMGGLRSALARLERAFADHIAITEGPAGLHRTLLEDAPRLEVPVRKLQDQHRAIESALEELASELGAGDGNGIDTSRERAETILALLSRHRRQGADLVYEAYQVDLGASE
jgi:hypothetical protein